MRRSSAFKTGVSDGVQLGAQGLTELGTGMTYGDHCDNEAYDRGVNLGISLGKAWFWVKSSVARFWLFICTVGIGIYGLVDSVLHLFGICIGK